jgi:ribosomal protein S27E
LPSVAPYPYVRHRPELTLLYQVIEHHLPEFKAELRDQHRALPRFVLREFDDYLRCGRLEHGFVRVKCTGCRNELLVAFSCKNRGFCPSCGARRMVDTAAHLLDRVLPEIPIRQWVLTFPWPLRLLYSSRPHHLSRTLAIVLRAVETHLIRRAGLIRTQGARSGAVTIIQRFGSALNLNVHLHMLVPDGVYTLEHGRPRFHTTPAPNAPELDALLRRIVARVTRQLERDGLLIRDEGEPHLDLDLVDPIDQLGAASIQYRVLLGPEAGKRTLTLRTPATGAPRSHRRTLTAAQDGFSLNASVACRPRQRRKLERLARYVARPPLALERLSVMDDGRLRYALKHPYTDGTTHFLFQPLDLLARLAALVPRPRVHLTRYHGVFAPNSRLRRRIVPGARAPETSHPADPALSTGSHPPEQHASHRLTWAERLKRTFEFDITVCPLCAGTLRVISDITDPAVIDTILAHLQHSRAPPARAQSHPQNSSAPQRPAGAS